MIECLDFRDLIPRYDREYTLFFLDPPYWKIDGYAHNFVEQDFYDLAELLVGIKGRFLMTINDTPKIREIFKRFMIEEVELKYSMNKKQGSRAQVRTELIIGNQQEMNARSKSSPRLSAFVQEKWGRTAKMIFA